MRVPSGRRLALTTRTTASKASSFLFVPQHPLHAGPHAASNVNGNLNGGNVSKPITGQAVTLSCLGLDGITKTKTATANILPSFQEL